MNKTIDKVVLSFIFFVLIGCHKKEVTQKLTLEIADRELNSDTDTLRGYPIFVTLKNPTKDTLRIVAKICPGTDLFFSDISDFKPLSSERCYTDMVTKLVLSPGSSQSFLMQLKPQNDITDYKGKEIRLGAYYILTTVHSSLQEITDLYSKRKRDNVIWSNSIKIK